MIIIISEPRDLHSRVVIDRIKKNYNKVVHLVDLSELSKTMYIELSYNKEINLRFNNVYGQIIDFREANSCWWRRPQPVYINPIIINPDHRNFILSEWNTALTGIWQSTNCLWINDVKNDFAASHKPYQLTIAKEIGLLVPDTLITNNPDSVVHFYEKNNGNIIFKAFTGTNLVWRETRPFKKEFLQIIENVRFAPVIFQEYLRNSIDIRVTIVGSEVFAAETNITFNNYPYDFRMQKVKWEIHKLPDVIENLLLQLMNSLGLEYGAIDLKLDKNGDYYFLEINPAGQFLFIEFDTKMPISDVLASRLINGIKK